MGSGGFITNQSMHWRVSHSDTKEDIPFSGRDPIPVDWIGRGASGTGPGSKDHAGFLRVQLRFTGANGRRSLESLLEYLRAHPPTDDYQLTIDVPMIPRDKEKLDQDLKDQNRWDVRIDW